jgi:hypothetical protein
MNSSPDSHILFFKTVLAESERGRIILLACKVDELLLELLKTYFKPSREKKVNNDKLFGRMGLLGAFSSRIEMAHRVGLISKQSARCIDMLREIRNDCAHGMEPFSYQKGALGDKFQSFKKLSYEISGMERFFTLVEKLEILGDIGNQQFSKADDGRFMMLTMAHMIMLQDTLTRITMIGDSFRSVENVKFGFQGLG